MNDVLTTDPLTTDLLNTVIEAHGGLERWNQLNNVSARLIQGFGMGSRPDPRPTI
jgi:hypothetical protein